jgi:hypothetical protein
MYSLAIVEVAFHKVENVLDRLRRGLWVRCDHEFPTAFHDDLDSGTGRSVGPDVLRGLAEREGADGGQHDVRITGFGNDDVAPDDVRT